MQARRVLWPLVRTGPPYADNSSLTKTQPEGGGRYNVCCNEINMAAGVQNVECYTTMPPPKRLSHSGAVDAANAKRTDEMKMNLCAAEWRSVDTVRDNRTNSRARQVRRLTSSCRCASCSPMRFATMQHRSVRSHACTNPGYVADALFRITMPSAVYCGNAWCSAEGTDGNGSGEWIRVLFVHVQRGQAQSAGI